ncbi:uncharacterized protein ColSpa_11199 [Colletotrichum spaethianum]|uniref:Uncharacterized protein n=1 Tax=Colletotrichum spaethianum TaxID=700344 RepID=A0AA37UT13_9PEZI|nr:uncharacterized protein ColSpa_11199 [Colletotrichum spaethianum]GKT51018.1 hypothetical protein ColSpa_11199 [Colletotrichum spaethianum]
MEWPSKACRFRPRDFRAFKYEERPSKVITVRLDNKSELEIGSLGYEELWVLLRGKVNELDGINMAQETDAKDDESNTLHIVWVLSE